MKYTGIRVLTKSNLTVGNAIGAITNESRLIKDEEYILQWKQIDYSNTPLMNHIVTIFEGQSTIIANNLNITQQTLIDTFTDEAMSKKMYLCHVKFKATRTGIHKFGICREITPTDKPNSVLFDIIEAGCERGTVLQDFKDNYNDIQEFIRYSKTYFEQTDKKILMMAKKEDINRSNAQIELTAESIKQKVSTDDFSSLIEQNATSIKISFNKINRYTQISDGEFSHHNSTGKTISLKNGRFNLFRFEDNSYLGSLTPSFLPNGSSKAYGINMFGAYPCWYMDFGVDYSSTSENDGFKAKSLLRLVFEDMLSNKKGTHIINAPLFIHRELNMLSNILYLHNSRYDCSYANDNGYVAGSSKKLMLGLQKNNDARVTSIIEIVKAGETSVNGNYIGSDGINIFSWLDMQNHKLWNTQIVNSYSDAISRSYSETTSIEGLHKQLRITVTSHTKQGKCKVNIPTSFLRIMKKYVILGLTKYGKGDIWIEGEYEDYFIVNSDVDMKFSLEIVIYKKDISTLSKRSINIIEPPVPKPNETTQFYTDI